MRATLTARAPLSRQPDTGYRSGRLESIFLIAVMVVYVAGYLSIEYLPGNSPYPLGWWGWWDQSQYLKSAQAFSRWNLDPSEHWYPLTYALLAAPFARFSPYHAFFFINLFSFIALAWLMMKLGVQLGVGAVGGAVAFLMGAVLPKVLLAQYVIPWTTTPVAALYAGIFLVYVICLRDGFTSGRVALMTGGVMLVAAFRPVDAVPLLPIALHVAWRSVLTDDAGVSALRRILLPAIVGGGVLVAYLGLHYAIYGARPSVYMQQSSVFGLNLAIVPFRFAMIFGDPTPFFGEGTGVLQRYPLVSVGLWALIYVTFWQRRLFGVAAAAWISILIYLAYPDYLPSGIWRYMNIHYWKWLFPIMALLSFVAIRDVLIRRNRAATAMSILLTAPLVLLSLKAVPLSPERVDIAEGHRVTLQVDQPVSIAAIRLQGVSGGDYEVYWGEHTLTLGDRTLRHIADFRLMRVGETIFAVPNRPIAARDASLVLDKRLNISAQSKVTVLHPGLRLRNPFRRTMSEADWRIQWRAPPKPDHKCEGEVPRNEQFPNGDGEFVHSAYEAIFGRPPDAEGFARSCKELVSGRMTRRQVIDGMLASPDYRERLK